MIAHGVWRVVLTRRRLGAVVAAQEILAGRSMTLGISCEILPEAPDALDQSLQQAATKQKGTAVADEGKRYARNRHQPDRHGDVHKHMHGEEYGDADGEQRTQAVPCGTSDA